MPETESFRTSARCGRCPVMAEANAWHRATRWRCRAADEVRETRSRNPLTGLRGQFESGERVWLNIRGRHVPAVVVGAEGRRVRLRVQRSDRWDAVRIVRGRARAGSLVRRESVHVVDGAVQP